MDYREKLHAEDLLSINAGLSELEADQIEFDHIFGVTQTLRALWEYDEPSPSADAVPIPHGLPSEDIGYPELEAEDLSMEEPGKEMIISHFEAPLSSWFIGLSKEFRKATEKIDRKLKGRILDAIGRIAENPMKQKGDTVKPMKGGSKGLWRYRIGDYRIVYHPDPQNERVVLLAFAARGAAYG
jgi:mRNA-degrading endonuclease RelE of RelBE toxin-antitoxin system